MCAAASLPAWLSQTAGASRIHTETSTSGLVQAGLQVEHFPSSSALPSSSSPHPAARRSVQNAHSHLNRASSVVACSQVPELQLSINGRESHGFGQRSKALLQVIAEVIHKLID
jgi:hypothetical protein